MIRNIFLFLLIGCMGCGGPFYVQNSDTDQEPGFQRVCWSSAGHAVYRDLRCADPEEIVWTRNRIPLIVSSFGDSSMILSAIQNFNSEFGCELLRYDGGALHPDVRVYLDAASEDGRVGGATMHTRLADGGLVATITTPHLMYDGVLLVMLQHEMGHLLGLAHDPFTFSIMFPNYHPDGSFMQVQHFTTHDRRLIRERYCL